MDRCFAPMVNWWRLAEQVLKAEFPAWHVQMAFEVFKFPCPLAMSQGTERRLTRLAELCQVETPGPLSEYFLMRPLVNDVFAAAGLPGCAAWARAVQDTTAEPLEAAGLAQQKKKPLQVLACYSAYASSPYGVEQPLSQQLAFCHLNGSPW